VVTDNAGNVIVAGHTDDGITGGDMLVIKYSGAGVLLWTNRYNGPANSLTSFRPWRGRQRQRVRDREIVGAAVLSITWR